MATGEPEDLEGVEDTASMPPDSRPKIMEPETHRRIGPYRLLHVIGEGGMGEVWVADQLEPVKRRVALKVIKAGMDTKQVIARFEAERQALAMMDHPAIAKVLDAGATGEGRPYFVMEYVPGVSITAHCDTHRLPTAERLKVFIEVCEGVQHAHQKAIIHRDLKPSNILVSLGDGKAQPKIIDFGIAKATGQRLTEKTLFTEVGAVIGTPEYMSPEQADLTGQDIDTRTDIYSLGVILYQLLTGELPFGSKDLRSSSYEEFRRKLKEVEPPHPSTRLGTTEDGGVEAARNRKTDPTRLQRELAGDLDAVAMKALEKDRTRRYGTAVELAADLERYLRHEPVVAQIPSRAYRFRKYARRHRALLTSVAAVVASLTVGVVATTAALFEARSARAEAIRQQALAEARLRSAQQYAEKLFFDISPGIQELPGATVFRTKLGKAGSEFVESLAVGAKDDPQLRWQTARIHLGLSKLQGWDYAGGSLRNYAEAIRSAERALQLLASLPADFPTRKEHLDAEFRCHDYFQGALASLRRFDEALEHLDRMETLAGLPESKDIRMEGAAAVPQSKDDRVQLATIARTRRANVLGQMGRSQEAIAIWREQIRLLDAEGFDAARATSLDIHRRSVAHSLLARNLLRAGDVESGISELRLALEFDHLKVERYPEITRYARDLAIDTFFMGRALLLHKKQIVEARKLMSEGINRLSSLASADAGNALVQDQHLDFLNRAAQVLFQAAQDRECPKEQRRPLLQTALKYWEDCRRAANLSRARVGRAEQEMPFPDDHPAKASEAKSERAAEEPPAVDCGEKQAEAARVQLAKLNER